MAVSQTITIAHVLHHLVIGGMENGVVNLVNHLPHHRFRHVILCVEDFSDFARRIARDDVEVIALHRSQVGPWGLRARIFRELRRVRPDIVHSRNLSGLDALLPARLLGIRTVHSEHGFDVDNLQGTATKPILLRRLHAPLINHFVCVSRDIGSLMTQRWGIAPSRVTQIYNGVDTERFAPPPERTRDRLPFGEREPGELFVVGTVGRVRPIKDQMTLIEAFARVGSDRPALRNRLRLVVVGDGPLLDSLRARAEALGVADRCWFPGARNDVPELMRCFDVFVLPSLNEGISNTLLESLACGVPTLATAVGGNPELVEDGVCGALFMPGDVAALAAHIGQYAADAEHRRRHGAEARKRAVERFSLSAMVHAYDRVYSGLAPEPASASLQRYR